MKFNLSEKRMMYLDKTKTYKEKRVNCYLEKDVKEFIREIKEGPDEELTIESLIKWVDKCAGKKLI